MIQIDMDMPRNCCECPFRSVQNNFACSAIEKFMNTAAYTDKRPEWCPLHNKEQESVSVLGQMNTIFYDFMNEHGYYPPHLIVNERIHGKMESEASEFFQSYMPISKYCGSTVHTVDDDTVFLITLDGHCVKYSLKEGREQK